VWSTGRVVGEFIGVREGWMLRALEAAHVRRWAVACVQSLDAHREAIDGINVYPVADGDTGSNLLHTMRAALDALLRTPAARTDARAALAALAHGALTGARGNSGVLISQLFRGLVDALPDRTTARTNTPATESPVDSATTSTDDPSAAPAAASASDSAIASTSDFATNAAIESTGESVTDPATTSIGDPTAAPAAASASDSAIASPSDFAASAAIESTGESVTDPATTSIGDAAAASNADSAATSAVASAGPATESTADTANPGSGAVADPASTRATVAESTGESAAASPGGFAAGSIADPAGSVSACAAAAEPASGSAAGSVADSADPAGSVSACAAAAEPASGSAAGSVADSADPAGGSAAASIADAAGSASACAAVVEPTGGSAASVGGVAIAAGGGLATDPATGTTGEPAAPGGGGGPAGAWAVSGAQLRDAFFRGAERAKAALADPVPGTMISVLAAAAAAAGAVGSDELGDIVAAAAAGAAKALEETPRQLPVLAKAGVVDAGGRGVVVVLDALVAVVGEQPAALAAAQRVRRERVVASGGLEVETTMYTARESGSDEFAYEVMYLLEGVNGHGDPISRLRDTLVGLGDCVSVVGDGAGLWTVHVHCNDIGAAIEVGVETGRPRQIRVARFADAPSAEASRFTKDRAVVVPARSTELADLLISEGVTVVRMDSVEDGDADETAYRLLEAITGSAAAHVTVLPGDPTLIEVCDEASIRAVAAGQDVVVVPCASAVQVLAAVAVHDPRRRASDDVVAMAEAAAATRRGEVVVTDEAAITWIGACEAGDVLGFADGEVVLIEPGPADVDALDRAACGVAERMLGMGGELVTALLGADAPDELVTELTDYLRREHPETELVVYHGGQADTVLILGVE
jgi:fatty acid kinase